MARCGHRAVLVIVTAALVLCGCQMRCTGFNGIAIQRARLYAWPHLGLFVS
jgi:hypothetical protein